MGAKQELEEWSLKKKKKKLLNIVISHLFQLTIEFNASCIEFLIIV